MRNLTRKVLNSDNFSVVSFKQEMYSRGGGGMGQYILSHRTSYGVKELTLEPHRGGGVLKN